MLDNLRYPVEAERFSAELEQIKNQYNNIYVILSPPRCASTAVARTFWKFPGVKAYSHEPFESNYYESTGLENVVANLNSPITLGSLTSDDSNKQSLVIKEMSFQVNDNFDKLAAVSNNPLLFLIRSPLLSIHSRYAKKREGGQSTQFPLRENGWEDLLIQVRKSGESGVPYYIMDTTDFRNKPTLYLQLLCKLYNVEYSDTMLRWSPQSDISLDNLGGKHDHLYRKVLSSTGILPPCEEVPSINDFIEVGGIRDYVRMACGIYDELRTDTQLIVLD